VGERLWVETELDSVSERVTEGLLRGGNHTAEGCEVIPALGGVHSSEYHLGAGAELVWVGQVVSHLIPDKLIDHRHNDGAAITDVAATAP
jgi:hypothetical protein